MPDPILVERRGVAAEQRDQATGGFQGEKDQAQQRRFSGARRSCQELEALRLDRERKVLEDLRPHVIAQADVLKADQTPLRMLSS